MPVSPDCHPTRPRHTKGEGSVRAPSRPLGHIGGAPVYISGPQYDAWKHTDLIIDVVPGRGGMFSLDNGRERRFLTRSIVCVTPGT